MGFIASGTYICVSFEQLICREKLVRLMLLDPKTGSPLLSIVDEMVYRDTMSHLYECDDIKNDDEVQSNDSNGRQFPLKVSVNSIFSVGCVAIVANFLHGGVTLQEWLHQYSVDPNVCMYVRFSVAMRLHLDKWDLRMFDLVSFAFVRILPPSPIWR